MLSLQLVYKLNKEILDKPADVLGLFRRILIKTLIRHLWFGNWWQQVGICKNKNNSYLVDLEGSAGKASENHKFLYHSFTFESQSSFQVEIFGLVLVCKYGGKFFVKREILHLRWMKCRFALSRPPGVLCWFSGAQAGAQGSIAEITLKKLLFWEVGFISTQVL